MSVPSTSTTLVHTLLAELAELIAAVATRDGARARLDALPEAFFIHVVERVRERGVAQRVIADMFGLPMTTFERRVRAGRTQTPATRRVESTVRDAVERLVAERGPLLREAVLLAMHTRDEPTVRSALRDLRRAGRLSVDDEGRLLVTRSSARARVGRQVRLDTLLTALAYHRGPVTTPALARLTGSDEDALAARLERLSDAGTLVRTRHAADDQAAYASTGFELARHTPDAWPAAILDHVRAMCRTVSRKLATQAPDGADRGAWPSRGSTWSLEVWPGHPLAEHVAATLDGVRDQLSDLRQRVARANAGRAAPAGAVTRLTVALGQTSEGR